MGWGGWENQNLWETDYEIRFTVYETDSVIRLIKKFANFFMKQIL